MKFVSILLTLALMQLVQSDDIRNGKDDEKEAESQPDGDPKAGTVRRFFEFEGLSPELDEQTLALYDQRIVDKMAESLEKKDDYLDVYALNLQVNALIYEVAQARVKVAKEPLELADEALLQTIELLAPNSAGHPVIALAKDDLRQFCLEQISSCRELLARIGTRLKQNDLHTMQAILLLESFYLDWVPLGRLSKYIDNHGQIETPQ